MRLALKLRLALIASAGTGIGVVAAVLLYSQLSTPNDDSAPAPADPLVDALAGTLAQAASTPLAQGDAAAAAALVSGASKQSAVAAAVLLDRDGQVVARSGAAADGAAAARRPVRDRDGQRIGEVQLLLHPTPPPAGQGPTVLGASALALALVLLLVLLFGGRLQRALLAPLRQVVAAMGEAGGSAGRQYAVRLGNRDDQDFQPLFAGFDDLLERVERRDQDLEAKVAARTRELQHANAALADKVEEAGQARAEAEAAAAARASFLATMSHEIRTPMNGVVGMLDLLVESGLDAEQLAHATTASRSAESLLHIINEVLDLSRIEAGQMQLEMLPTNVGDLVEDVVAVLWPQADGKGIDLAAEVDPALYGRFETDPTRLRQVLTNLTGNAIKFTERGHVVVRANLSQRADGRTRMTLAVTDTGIGIPREAQATLFDAFTQAEQSTSRRFGGTGLGLSISQQIATALDGTIRVDSRPGKGSTFTVDLPAMATGDSTPAMPADQLARAMVLSPAPAQAAALAFHLGGLDIDCVLAIPDADPLAAITGHLGRARPLELLVLDLDAVDPGLADAARRAASDAGQPLRVLTFARPGAGATLTRPLRRDALLAALDPDPAAAASRAAASPGHRDLSGARVLLVEDNAVNRKVACGVLKKFGIEPEIAEDGRQAVARACAQHYDLVLMDCQLPEIDGFEATAAIRRWEASQARPRCPVIALTASAMDEDRQRADAAGMDAYLAKPFKLADMAALLDAWLPADGSAADTGT